MIPFTIKDFPFDILQYVMPARRANGHPKYSAKRYADIISTFDIESTNLDDIRQAIMYHWQVCVDGLVCIGRTWEEFKDFLKGVDKYLPNGLCMVIYVHNLGY